MSTITRVLDANVNGAVYTANVNSALEALDTCHSGATPPTDEVANGKLWLDTSTTPGILKIYNNATWEVIAVSASSPEFSGLTVGGTITANQFVGSGAIILVSNQSDNATYSTTSTSYQDASRFQVTPSSSTSRLLGWFFCQMKATGSQSDGDLGNIARAHFRSSSASWVAISSVAYNLRTSSGTTTDTQGIAVTLPILLTQDHLNAGGVWDVAMRHFGDYDATSEIGSSRFHYMEFEP